jgi:beta-glucanase (GH16 family)
MLRIPLKIVWLLMLAAIGISFTGGKRRTEKNKWKLTWREEFNYQGLPDSAKWNYDVGGAGWGNDELQYYTEKRKANSYVSNGCLYIQAVKEKYEGNEYTSARLVTKGKQDFKYGKIEIRAKLPKGKGLWPAIWMLSSKVPVKWPDDGEIDIMEHVGYMPQEITGAAHVKRDSTGISIFSSVNETDVTAPADSFHLYSLIWTPNRLEWYVDNKLFHFYEKADRPAWHWPFDHSFYLILNVAVGGSWGGKKGIDDSVFPQSFLVDYVRFYRRQ